MDKIKNFFRVIFSNEFLLKILIITAIFTLLKGHFQVDIWHGGNISIGVDSPSSGFEIKIKE